MDRIAQQAQKVKGKWQERKRRGARRAPAASDLEAGVVETSAPAPAAVPAVRPRMPRIFRASRQEVESMSVADAARQIEAGGDGVIIFRDPDRAAISVLYRGQNGELTLVETEA